MQARVAVHIARFYEVLGTIFCHQYLFKQFDISGLYDELDIGHERVAKFDIEYL